MRETEFKAKRIDNGEWVFGDYYKKMVYAANNGKSYLVHYISTIITIDDGICCDEFNEYWEINPDTLCEYTGEKINETKIYEHDLISDGEYTREVFFEDGVFQTEYDSLKWDLQDNCMKIVGNKYDK